VTTQEIRKKYLEFFESRGHKIIPRASLVPKDDPTTLFTGSGMQPLIPYLLGQTHPQGKRLVDSQTCFRAEDMDEVGDNRHTTFFEMLGNWSLGDYYKKEQLNWCWEFLTQTVGLPKEKLWITCFEGDEALRLPRDDESAAIWEKIGVPKEKIRFYGADKNWWSREGEPANMQVGEPGGPDSEVFYEFTDVEHDPKFGKECHPNCDCGRFLEIGNSVFMTYKKTATGFDKLPSPNVDFGGGLERIAAAKQDNPDIFKNDLIWPVIQGLEEASGKNYDEHQLSMRVIADHLRAATFLAVDGVVPSNKTQGYVLRRLVRRAVRFAFDLGIEKDLCKTVVPVVTGLYQDDFPEIAKNRDKVAEILDREEKLFRQTLRHGLREFRMFAEPGEYVVKGSDPTMQVRDTNGRTNKISKPQQLTGANIFKLYDTHGFPVELSLEEASKQGLSVDENWKRDFDKLMTQQRERSQTAAQGMFRGGLADASEEVVRLHTATHLMYQALSRRFWVTMWYSAAVILQQNVHVLTFRILKK
jgi:alanyl-tRNA synthetase